MKRFFTLSLLACLAAAALNAQAAKPKAAAWETVGNAAFAQTLMYGFAKIALAPDGTLWAMVNNKYTTASLEVFSLAKGADAWAKAGRGTFYDNAYNGSIAIDAAGNPWLATKDAVFTLVGKKWTPTYIGTYWTDSGKQYAKAYELGNFCSIVAGPKGKLYVADDYYAGVFEKDEVLAAKDWDEKVYDASRQVSFFPVGADKTEYGIGYKAGPNFAGNPNLVSANDILYLPDDLPLGLPRQQMERDGLVRFGRFRQRRRRHRWLFRGRGRMPGPSREQERESLRRLPRGLGRGFEPPVEGERHGLQWQGRLDRYGEKGLLGRDDRGLPALRGLRFQGQSLCMLR